MKRFLSAIVLTFALIASASADVPPSNVVHVIVEDKGDTGSNGTGTLVRPDLILTNWHVVKDRVGKVRIVFPGWFVYEAKVVKVDKKWDLAALQIEPLLLPPIELGVRAEKGDIVVVGGYGSGRYKVVSGKVLAFYSPGLNSPEDIMQIDAKVRSGDSGGPMLKDGKLVGVLFGCRPDGTYGATIDRVKKFLKGVK
jgi:S1-C subfamily serine protease